MSQIYVSGPYSFTSGVRQVVKDIKNKGYNVVYSEKGADYQFSKLEQSNYVVFVLDKFAWKQKLESISKGTLSELLWCINHRIPIFLAYKSATGLGIYTAEIDENLNFTGIANTADNFYKIMDEKLGTSPIPSTWSLRIENGHLVADTCRLTSLQSKDAPTVEQLNYFY